MAKPTIGKVNHTFTEDTLVFSGNVLTEGGAFDADGDTITVATVDGGHTLADGGIGKGTNTYVGDYGVLTMFQDGSYQYKFNESLNLKNGEVVVEDFAIKVRDGTGNYSTTVLKFNVQGIANQKPGAVDDNVSGSGPTVTGNVLANDSDPDGDTLHVGTVNALGVSYHITGQSNVAVQGTYGTLTISDDGHFSYAVDYSDPDTIAAGSNPFTEHFTYKPHDGQNGEGNNTDFAQLNITIDPSAMA